MDVNDIVMEWLKERGYDGLFNSDGECGCLVDDLAPCGEGMSTCVPGYKRMGRDDEECDWYIGPEKPTEEGEST